jgi:hypothetical protein
MKLSFFKNHLTLDNIFSKLTGWQKNKFFYFFKECKMNKLKSLFFTTLTILCFTSLSAENKEFEMPIIKILPFPKDEERMLRYNYLLMIENFSGSELFIFTRGKMFYTALDKLIVEKKANIAPTFENTENLTTIFFGINAEHFLPGEDLHIRCVHLEKRITKDIFFMPKAPIEVEDENDDDHDGNEEEENDKYVIVESDPNIIEMCYQKLKKESFFTLSDMEAPFPLGYTSERSNEIWKKFEEKMAIQHRK